MADMQDEVTANSESATKSLPSVPSKQLEAILRRLDTGGYSGWGGVSQAQSEVEILFNDRVIKLLSDIVMHRGCGCLVCDDIKDRLTKLTDLQPSDPDTNKRQAKAQS